MIVSPDVGTLVISPDMSIHGLNDERSDDGDGVAHHACHDEALRFDFGGGKAVDQFCLKLSHLAPQFRSARVYVGACDEVVCGWSTRRRCCRCSWRSVQQRR